MPALLNVAPLRRELPEGVFVHTALPRSMCAREQRRRATGPTLSCHVHVMDDQRQGLPAESRMSGGTVIAPGAPVFRSRGRRAADIARDVVFAVLLIWALPLAVAIAMIVVQFAVAGLTR